MKKFRIYLTIILLMILLIYVTNITEFPSNIVLFEGEDLNISTIFGVMVKEKDTSQYKTIETAGKAETENVNYASKKNLELSLFGKIPVKEVAVNVIPRATVIPVGSNVGLKLYTNGVLVVGMSEIEKAKPYENSGIKEGDMIVQINNSEITCTADLVQTVNDSNGDNVSIKYLRNDQIHETNMEPAKTKSNEYKLGLWVRDAAAGVGTLTYYEPSTKMFAALGHGIVDIDTQELLSIAKGEIITTNILEITKGTAGKPGEIRGSIVNQTIIGEISKNTQLGIYGTLQNTALLNINKNDELEVALRDEIKTGKAKIICTLENNLKREYEIEIQKIYKNNNINNKSMLIKVTDAQLLEITGGIIQRHEWFTYYSKWKVRTELSLMYW